MRSSTVNSNSKGPANWLPNNCHEPKAPLGKVWLEKRLACIACDNHAFHVFHALARPRSTKTGGANKLSRSMVIQGHPNYGALKLHVYLSKFQVFMVTGVILYYYVPRYLGTYAASRWPSLAIPPSPKTPAPLCHQLAG